MRTVPDQTLKQCGGRPRRLLLPADLASASVRRRAVRDKFLQWKDDASKQRCRQHLSTVKFIAVSGREQAKKQAKFHDPNHQMIRRQSGERFDLRYRKGQLRPFRPEDSLAQYRFSGCQRRSGKDCQAYRRMTIPAGEAAFAFGNRRAVC
jgi:hypothetical protein